MGTPSPPSPSRTARPPADDRPDGGVPGRLVELVQALRSKGIPAGTSETVDAADAIRALGLDDRDRLREGLASALVRRGGQREVFDSLFDLYFPAAVGAAQSSRNADTDGALDLSLLRERLVEALAQQDAQAVEELARLAVDRFGEVGSAEAGTRSWSALQTLRQLALETLVAHVVARRQTAGGGTGDRAGGGPAPGLKVGDWGPDESNASVGAQQDTATHDQPLFTDRLARDEVRRDVDRVRRLVEAEARRRAAEVRGRDRMTRYAVADSPDRTDFLTATLQQYAALRAAVRPLSRKLATRLAARRRRSHRGGVDVRRTLRRSMSTGGVPMKPVYRRPRPTRPELVLLCDVSGSVAGFSTFTMLLVRALADQFGKVRVFAFVNAMDEVTELVQRQPASADLGTTILREARVTTWHGSSDYGEALADFAEQHLAAVGPRTAVLILGDGRNNYGDPNLFALQRIRDASRRTFWLNPESRGRWGTGDSNADEYAGIVEMHECRTIDQLSRFISRLLPV